MIEIMFVKKIINNLKGKIMNKIKIGFLSLLMSVIFVTTPLIADQSRFPEMNVSEPEHSLQLLRDHLKKYEDDEFIKVVDAYTKAYLVDMIFLLKELNADDETLIGLSFYNLVNQASGKTHEEFTLYAKEKIDMVGKIMTESFTFNEEFIMNDNQQMILWDFIEAYDESIIVKMESKMSMIDTDIIDQMMQLENPTEEDLTTILFGPFIGKTINELIGEKN